MEPDLRALLAEGVRLLREGVPCGGVMGHGQRCEANYLCDGCDRRLKGAEAIEVVLFRDSGGR